MSADDRGERRAREPGVGAPYVGGSGCEPPGAAFYGRPAAVVARDLLGMLLESTVDGAACVARIVETEAYIGPEDEASHASARIGRTRRNAAMFGEPGTAYVYRIYGVHWCLNAVTDVPGHPAAVLIRAASIVEGAEIARRRRGDVPDSRLLCGPGNLCRALGITGELDHHRLDREPLRILQGPVVGAEEVLCGPRIGISRAVDLPLRFRIRDDPAVSHPRR